jgi:DNA-binding LacI/PurR family transcriptional regulator
MKSTRPTSRDIARLAEVSQATVSRALRNSALVRPETRERIESIARQLSYRADRRAASLRTRRSNTLALLLFEESPADAQINPFFLSMLGHITRATALRGFDLLVSFQQLSDDWHTDYQLSNRADGLILLGYGDYLAAQPRLQKLADAGAHFVIWGTEVDGRPGRCVRTDNIAGGLQATQHLLRLGRRRIAYIGSASGQWPEFQARYAGYERALHEAGIAPDPALLVDARSSEQSGREAANALLATGVPFDAVFAASDLIAMGAIGALHCRNRAVPGDVAVVGFDDITAAAHFIPPLTTVQQDTHRAAHKLVDNLLCMTAGEPVESARIEPKLLIRSSCGSPPVRRIGASPA